MSRLSAKERKIRKEVWRIIRADNIVGDPAASPSVRFALALILSCSADTHRAARVADVSEAERRAYVANLRQLRLIHHDRLDLGELMQSDGVAVVMVVLVSMICAGKIDSRQPCRKCGASCARAGYTAAGAQRWRCSAGCGELVYMGNELERMQAHPDTLRKALELAKKGWKASGIAQQSGVTTGQAQKILGILDDDPEVEVSPLDMWYTAGAGIHGKTPTKWRPKADSLHRAVAPDPKLRQRQRRSDA